MRTSVLVAVLVAAAAVMVAARAANDRKEF
jgi:hypothetical protein